MSDPVDELQIEAATTSGVLRQMANRIDESDEEPSGAAVVVCYPSGVEIGHYGVDLGELVDGADMLVERLLELLAVEAN